MTKDQFIALGFTEEQATKAAEASAEELKGFIPKARFDEVNEAKKQAEEDRDAVSGQLETLKKSAGANEDLKEQIEKLQEANKTTKEQYESKIKDMTINSAIQAKLTDTKYPDLLSGKFDKSKLSIASDGSVVGIDEQLTTIKEQYKDLFVPPVKGREPNNRNITPSGEKNPWSKEHFNLTEQGRLLRENPELAAQLKAAAQ